MGFATSDSSDNSSYVQALASTIQDGGKVSLSSTASDIRARGAQIAAGHTLTLNSDTPPLEKAIYARQYSASPRAEASLPFFVGNCRVTQ
ncbi:hemagglutinin repeat-containing protein [Herbaspirillum camelliae]|uniref:hemagglutinin repeat-containing protein n=1 Tax=Herbaspirillum camelliae TaxID=1892903 RepID=UPI0009F89A48